MKHKERRARIEGPNVVVKDCPRTGPINGLCAFTDGVDVERPYFCRPYCKLVTLLDGDCALIFCEWNRTPVHPENNDE